MKIVTGAVRSAMVGVTIFRVEDVLESKLSFYGFGGASSDEEVSQISVKLQQSIDDGDAFPAPYSDEQFARRQEHFEEAGDYEILDHLIKL